MGCIVIVLCTVSLSDESIVFMAFCRSRIMVIYFLRSVFVITSLFVFFKSVDFDLSLTTLGASVIAARSNSCLRVVMVSFATVSM